MWYQLTEVLAGGRAEARVVPYEQIAEATNNFDLREKIGDGRFGPVFQVRIAWSLHCVVGFITYTT